MPTQAETFFRQLTARALVGAKGPPQLLEVLPIDARGWLLRYRVGAAETPLELSAELVQPAGSELRYSYRTPPDPESAIGRRLARAGWLLSQALARVEPGPLPPLVEPEPDARHPYLERPERPHRESLTFSLRGDCDRACSFCSKVLFTDPPPPIVRARIAQLPVVNAARADPARALDATSLPELEATLRARIDQRDALQVAFTGRDCLASPDFDDALRTAYTLGYRDMSVQSPGSRLLEPGFIEFLRAHGIGQVGLTAHAADEARFDRVGGKAGAYQAFWDGLEALLAAGIQVDLAVPLIAATLDTLPRHLARLVELPCGIDCFYWYPGDLMDPLFVDIGASFTEAIAALERAAERVPPRRVSIGGVPSCVVPESLQDHFVWSYEAHLVGYQFERIEPCGACSLADSCPGILPVYLEQRGAVSAARAVPPAPESREGQQSRA